MPAFESSGILPKFSPLISDLPPKFDLSFSAVFVNLGEGKWGRAKYRRIPEREGDWKG